MSASEQIIILIKFCIPFVILGILFYHIFSLIDFLQLKTRNKQKYEKDQKTKI